MDIDPAHPIEQQKTAKNHEKYANHHNASKWGSGSLQASPQKLLLRWNIADTIRAEGELS